MKENEQCPYLATDAIIEYREGIVLIERKNFPYGLALPGGFAIAGLTLDQNVRKEVLEETGLSFIVQEDPEAPFCVHHAPDRDPRSHVISVVYTGKGLGTLQAGDDAKEAHCYSIAEVKDSLGKGKFAFYDHERILTKYLNARGHI